MTRLLLSLAASVLLTCLLFTHPCEAEISGLDILGDDAFISLGEGSTGHVRMIKSAPSTMTIEGDVTLTGALTASDVELEGSGSTLSALVTLVNTMNARLATAEGKLNDAEAELEDARARLAAVEVKVNDTSETLGSLDDKVVDLRDDLGVVQLKVNDTSETLGSLDTKVMDLRDDLGVVELKVNDTSETLGSLDDKVVDLRDDLGDGQPIVYNVNASDPRSLETIYNGIPKFCTADYTIQLPAGAISLNETISFLGHPCDGRITIQGTDTLDEAARDMYEITCDHNQPCLLLDPRPESGGSGTVGKLTFRGFRITRTVTPAGSFSGGVYLQRHFPAVFHLISGDAKAAVINVAINETYTGLLSEGPSVFLVDTGRLDIISCTVNAHSLMHTRGADIFSYNNVYTQRSGINWHFVFIVGGSTLTSLKDQYYVNPGAGVGALYTFSHSSLYTMQTGVYGEYIGETPVGYAFTVNLHSAAYAGGNQGGLQITNFEFADSVDQVSQASIGGVFTNVTGNHLVGSNCCANKIGSAASCGA